MPSRRPNLLKKLTKNPLFDKKPMQEPISVSSTTALHDFPISPRKNKNFAKIHDDVFQTESLISNSDYSSGFTIFDCYRNNNYENCERENSEVTELNKDKFLDQKPEKLFADLTLEENDVINEVSNDNYHLENHSDDETMYLLHEYYKKLKAHENGNKFKYNNKKNRSFKNNNLEKKAMQKNELAKLSKRYNEIEKVRKTRNFSEDSRANDFLDDVSSRDLQDSFSKKVSKSYTPTRKKGTNNKKQMNILNPIKEKSKDKNRAQDQKIKDLKGADKKIMQACFKDNLKNNRSVTYWTCPFDPSHRVQPKIYKKHVYNCRDYLAPNTEILECPFNSNHLLLKENYAEHVRRCVDQGPYLLQGSGNGLAEIAVEVQ